MAIGPKIWEDHCRGWCNWKRCGFRGCGVERYDCGSLGLCLEGLLEESTIGLVQSLRSETLEIIEDRNSSSRCELNYTTVLDYWANMYVHLDNLQHCCWSWCSLGVLDSETLMLWPRRSCLETAEIMNVWTIFDETVQDQRWWNSTWCVSKHLCH